MIKSNELRLENKIYLEKDNYVYFGTVTGIKKDEIQIDGKLNVLYSSLDLIKPIPITPETLEQAGFTKGSKEIEGQSISVDLRDNNVSCSGVDACTNGHAFFIENIKYLHQLQNIYFFLTGEELEINLTVDTPTQLSRPNP